MKLNHHPVLILLAGALSACGAATGAEGDVLTGLMDATEIDVASKVPGRIQSVHVREGDRVRPGQLLVRIESHEIEAKLAQANAAIGAAQAKLRIAQAGARPQERRAASKQLRAAEHSVEITKKAYERLNRLRLEDAVPQATFDEAEFRYKVALEQLAMAEAKRDLIRTGARAEEVEALQALVQQARGVLDEVEGYSEETEQTAPLKAEVASVILHPGELAATGHPILTLVDLDDQWASFAVREDELREIRTGAKIDVNIPALGAATYPLEVFHISALGDFATWRATSARDSFDLKTFEVRARPVEAIEGLRPGMTVRWKR